MLRLRRGRQAVKIAGALVGRYMTRNSNSISWRHQDVSTLALPAARLSKGTGGIAILEETTQPSH
jgi:hypothetical protein